MVESTYTEGKEKIPTTFSLDDGLNVTGTASITGAATVSTTLDVTGVTTLTGAATLESAVLSKFVKHVAHVSGVTVNSTAGDSPAIGTFAQPANTIITGITIFCATAPVCGSGDIGYEVGTSSSGAQIVAAQTDEILDAGTTVVVGSVTQTALVLQTQDAATAPISVQYASAARNVFCNITNTVNATTAGSFTFIIEYVQIA